MSFPTTPILDNFNRADGALGTDWTGGGGSAPTIVSNQVHVAAAGGFAFWNTQFARGVEVYFTLPVLQTSGMRGYACWSGQDVTTRNGYRMNLVAAANQMIISRYDAGVETVLAGSGISGFTAGDIFGMQVFLGGTILGWRKIAGVWTNTISTSDATYTSGFIGFDMNDNTVRMDNFGGGQQFQVPEIKAMQAINRAASF